MTLALVPYTGDTLSRARRWTDLKDDELRRRAIEAARDKDGDALWSLTEAHLTVYGPAGAKTSPHTLRAYRRGVSTYLTYANTRAVSLLHPTRDAGPTFLREREAAGKSPATVRSELAAVRLLYRALRWSGATNADPFTDAKPAPDKTAAWDKRHPYSETEVRALVDAAEPTIRALVLLGAHAGLRINEALALEWPDIDLGIGIVRVRHGKGGKARGVALSDTLSGALKQLTPRGPERELFRFSDVAARKRLKVLCRRAGVDYKGFHALRHYAGTRLVREGFSLDDAARHLGHSTLETTRIYAKWSDDNLKRGIGRW